MLRKSPTQLDREIAEALAKGDHATKKRPVPRGRYWIAPASDPKDRYAAGYDGNQFSSRKEAEAAIRSLRRLGGEFDVAWVVNEDALAATLHATSKQYRLERMFYGNRDEASLVSRHRALDAAVRAASRWHGGDGWGVRVVDSAGVEVDLWPEYRRLGLA
jgi:hypothetical protein